MGYFDNFDNEFLNKYEKNLKNRKILWICSSIYGLMVFKFHAISLLFDTSSRIIKILYNLQWL
jgi:hypothetical protein